MNLYLSLLDAATATAGNAQAPAGGGFTIILVYVAFIALMYFLLIRPQRKRQKEQEKMQSSVQTGSWILLNNGMYGKVVNLINDCVIVEFGTNKSIMIPVLKNQIAAIAEPDLTPHVADEAAVAPVNEIVSADVAEAATTVKDGLDDYDRYILEQGEKKAKKGLFGKKKNED